MLSFPPRPLRQLKRNLNPKHKVQSQLCTVLLYAFRVYGVIEYSNYGYCIRVCSVMLSALPHGFALWFHWCLLSAPARVKKTMGLPKRQRLPQRSGLGEGLQPDPTIGLLSRRAPPRPFSPRPPLTWHLSRHARARPKCPPFASPGA